MHKWAEQALQQLQLETEEGTLRDALEELLQAQLEQTSARQLAEERLRAQEAIQPKLDDARVQHEASLDKLRQELTAQMLREQALRQQAEHGIAQWGAGPST